MTDRFRAHSLGRRRLFHGAFAGAVALGTGALSQGTATARPSPVRPTAAGYYGSGCGADSLANTQVGGTDGSPQRQVSMRFLAENSGPLTALRTYVKYDVDRPGYSGGTGGTLRFALHADDGSAEHAPTGPALASVDHPEPVGKDAFPLLTFPSAPTVTAGTLHHVVVSNIDPNPAENFASINALLQPGDQPVFRPEISGLLYKDESWTPRPEYTPILELHYGDEVAGNGYMEVWVDGPRPISGTDQVRQAFTVSQADRTVTRFSVRATRTGGDSPLAVRLETAAGSVVEEGTIPAADFGEGSTWVGYPFTRPHTLTAGQSYHVVLSAPADSSYAAYPIRDGSVDYGFDPRSTFADGLAQYTGDGNWVGWDMWGESDRQDGDLQFYFDVRQ